MPKAATTRIRSAKVPLRERRPLAATPTERAQQQLAQAFDTRYGVAWERGLLGDTLLAPLLSGLAFELLLDHSVTDNRAECLRTAVDLCRGALMKRNR